MNLNNLNEILESEPSYRKKQAEKLIYQELIEDWDEAKTLPLSLRAKLNKECPLSIKNKIVVSDNKKTVKALITLSDNLKIESVLMRHDNGKRNTVCVSSQVGCPLDCKFCATGKMGFKRNLEYFEIVDQAILFNRYLKKEKEKITNLVFMGMGEPFLNYDNVFKAIRILNSQDCFGLGARRISISTIGITDKIKKMAKEKLQINLAISLHVANDASRSKIIPINKKYPIEKIFEATDYYLNQTQRKVMIEYIMIDGLNDSDQNANNLADLITRKHLYFVNLISYNPTGLFKPSSRERIKKFKEILGKNSINTTERYRLGKGIKAACGQLASDS